MQSARLKELFLAALRRIRRLVQCATLRLLNGAQCLRRRCGERRLALFFPSYALGNIPILGGFIQRVLAACQKTRRARVAELELFTAPKADEIPVCLIEGRLMVLKLTD